MFSFDLKVCNFYTCYTLISTYITLLFIYSGYIRIRMVTGQLQCKTTADCLNQVMPCDFVACDQGICVCNTATINFPVHEGQKP